MNVQISADLEVIIRRQVDSGRYDSADDVVRAALHLMEQRDLLEPGRHAEIRDAIAAGVTSLKAGRGRDGDAFFDELEADLVRHDE